MKPLLFKPEFGDRPTKGKARGDVYVEFSKGLIWVWSGRKWIKSPKKLASFFPKGVQQVKIVDLRMAEGKLKSP